MQEITRELERLGWSFCQHCWGWFEPDNMINNVTNEFDCKSDMCDNCRQFDRVNKVLLENDLSIKAKPKGL